MGHDWTAAYRLGSQDNRPIVTELRLFPRERSKRRSPGTWSAERHGSLAAAPLGGITASLLRRVSLSDYAQFAGRVPAALTGDLVEKEVPRPRRPSQRGRKPRSERAVAEIAQCYAETVSAGSSRPVAEVALKKRIPEATVRNVIHQARQQGLLSKTLQGRVGGQLTAKAKKLLRRRRGD